MGSRRTGSSALAAGARPQPGVRVAALAAAVFVAMVALEVALRAVPGAISPKLLILFDPGLRETLATGEFPLKKDYREVERDDAGPPLLVPQPQSRIVSIDHPAGDAGRTADELGFCNPPGRAAREHADVVALGDSFTWCHAVMPAQAWPAQLEERTGLSTVSLGIGGKGPYEYLQLLRAFGLAKTPRIVVMNIYGGNDLRDAEFYRQHERAIARGETPPAADARNIAPWLASSAIGRHSYAINFVVAALSRAADLGIEDWEKSRVDARYRIGLPAGEVDFNVQNRDRDEARLAERVATGAVQVQLWDDALRRFGELARDHGFTAVVTYTPAAYAAYTGKITFSDPSLAASLDGLDEAQRRHLAERAAKDGYLFHDLTPDLRDATAHEAADELLYDPVHVHLTVRGNEVVAKSVARFLEERGLASEKE